MSHTEYFDLFYAAQNKNCKFRAFLIDVAKSKQVLKDYKEYHKFHLCVDYITEKLCQIAKDKNKQILVQNENTIIQKFFDGTIQHDNLTRNPMILGDCACYLVNEDTIKDKDFIKILCYAIKEFDIDFSFHFASGKYETESYAEGGKKLYKGYMLPLLEDISKTNGIIIDKNYKITQTKEINL